MIGSPWELRGPSRRSQCRFGAHRHRRTLIIAACVAALGGCGLAIWTHSGFPERFPGLDMQKISEAKVDVVVFRPTKGMEVFDHNWTLVTHIGEGERKVALSGDSLLFHYGPRVQQLADEGAPCGEHLFRGRRPEARRRAAHVGRWIYWPMKWSCLPTTTPSRVIPWAGGWLKTTSSRGARTCGAIHRWMPNMSPHGGCASSLRRSADAKRPVVCFDESPQGK